MNITLISHHLCPYVQRAAISLQEKQVEVDRTYIDLANKPGWFMRLSPLGKVPLLKVGSSAIFESAPILEYLEDTQPNPLHPADPLKRAQHRAWIEFGSNVLNGIGALYNAPDQTAFTSASSKLHGKFTRIEADLSDGPWFAGNHFSLVDTAFGPVFRYFDVFDEIIDFGILHGLPRVTAWRGALSARASVQNAVTPDYPDRLMTFLRARKSHLSSQIGTAMATAV